MSLELTSYRTLGRSGLIVSPFALGTMTFGQERWGTDEAASRAIFDAYVEAGGNFVDTANVYANGRSEELVGRFLRDGGLRDRVVLATKFGFNADAGIPIQGVQKQGQNPYAGGNGRKNIHQALDASLRRLGTDAIDLYWLHVWDMVTPVEEVLQTLGDLVRAGKIRYFGFSDMPAWYVTKAATLAAAHSVPGPIAMQLEYGLSERTIEQEHIPAALECGLGVVPWGPLAAGFLTGKYRREDTREGEGRLNGPNPYGEMKFTERNWQLLNTLKAVAGDLDKPLAQVALAWVAQCPGVTSTILGASRVAQLQDNLAALSIVFTDTQRATLDEASALAPTFPYFIFQPGSNARLFGGQPVTGWSTP